MIGKPGLRGNRAIERRLVRCAGANELAIAQLQPEIELQDASRGAALVRDPLARAQQHDADTDAPIALLGHVVHDGQLVDQAVDARGARKVRQNGLQQPHVVGLERALAGARRAKPKKAVRSLPSGR